MTTLHDRLADLAESATSGALDPELWDRGLRIRRRRHVGTLVITGVCVLVVAVLGLLDWKVSRPEVQPAGELPALALPDRIEKPSPWLPGTEGKPFGPLAAVLRADRGSWTGSAPGVVGVSAATGEYRFLDLPSRADQEVALSPDGRYVGYWLTGSVSGRPGVAEGDPVVGFAVYDVTTGRTLVREDLGSEHGLMPDALTWIDATHLGISSSRLLAYDDRAGTRGAPSEAAIVDVADREVTPYDGSIVDGGGGGWVLATWGTPSRLRPLDSPRVFQLRGESGVQPVVDPAGRHVAGLRAIRHRGGTTLTPAPLGVADLRSGQRGRLEPVPGDRRYYGVLGWRDDHTVLASGPSLLDGGWFVFAVDVRTGATEKLLRTHAGDTQLAAGLLGLPVVDRPEPPHPWDPRLVGGLVVGVVVLAGAAVLVWRRRVGP